MITRNSILMILIIRNFVLGGQIQGKVNILFEDNNKDAVVYIAEIPGKIFIAPSQHELINQKDFQFIPKVLPVLKGTIVDFMNSDSALHNVFSPDAPQGKFNLGTWPTGLVRADTFDTEGIATILCNVHPEMEAYVLVLNTPFFTKSDSLGFYNLANVPEGTYTITVWYFSEKSQHQKVVVPAEGKIIVNFTFK